MVAAISALPFSWRWSATLALPALSNSARVVKFAKDGRFIKTWGHKGPAPGDFDDPHDIFVGGSLGRVYVADLNSRIQVFDQDGNFVAAWQQFGQPSSVFVGPDDTLYVGAAFRDEATRRNATSRPQPGELRGIMVGNAIDGARFHT
jgi:DNA-binding beta-propeller fold protein YncE